MNFWLSTSKPVFFFSLSLTVNFHSLPIDAWSSKLRLFLDSFSFTSPSSQSGNPPHFFPYIFFLSGYWKVPQEVFLLLSLSPYSNSGHLTEESFQDVRQIMHPFQWAAQWHPSALGVKSLKCSWCSVIYSHPDDFSDYSPPHSLCISHTLVIWISFLFFKLPKHNSHGLHTCMFCSLISYSLRWSAYFPPSLSSDLSFKCTTWERHSLMTHIIASTSLHRASQLTLVVENPPANAGEERHAGLTCGLGRDPGGGHDNSLQYSSNFSTHALPSILPWSTPLFHSFARVH